jgi:hypothetical protein
MIIVDLTGKKFSRLTVIKLTNQSRSGSKVWECLCDCGNTCYYTTKHINRSYAPVKSCGCLRIENNLKTGKDSPYFKGYEGISQHWYNTHVLRSCKGYDGKNNKRQPVDINIDIKYLWELFQEQNGKCKLTGLDIILPKTGKDICTASVDRIDSSKGYVKGNIQWVHQHINRMKNTFEQQHFIDMCKLVANNCPIK